MEACRLLNTKNSSSVGKHNLAKAKSKAFMQDYRGKI